MAAPVRVSDHALSRWLDRSGALDVTQLRDILARSIDRAYQAGAKLGVKNFVILADDLVYVVRDGVLVTVLNDDGTYARAHSFELGHQGGA